MPKTSAVKIADEIATLLLARKSSWEVKADCWNGIEGQADATIEITNAHGERYKVTVEVDESTTVRRSYNPLTGRTRRIA